MVYSRDPVVVRSLFEESTHKRILSFLDEVVPFMRMDADVDLPDGPSRFGRRYAHNVPFFVDIHRQMNEYASDLFGRKLKPSYVFLSMYETGGQCSLHLDRPQCRYTIDYLITQDGQDPWPIDVGPEMADEELAAIEDRHPSGHEAEAIIDSVRWTRALLKPNDAVCYSGTHSWHYRPTRSVGRVSLAFFHFVPEGFDGTLN